MTTFLDLPTDVINELSINDVDDIMNLSRVNKEMHHKLTTTVKSLTSDRNLIILDDKWLVNYPLIASVSDNILFRIENQSLTYLPYSLKKFNIYIDDPIKLQLPAKDIIYFIMHIIYRTTSILHHSINEYTIRFIVKLPSIKKDYTHGLIIIDQGQYQIYLENIDNEYRNLKFIIEPYFSKLGLKRYDKILFGDIVYPNKELKNFIKDLLMELNLELPGYNQYGYILHWNEGRQCLIDKILRRYIEIKKLLINNSCGASKDFYYAKSSDLLEKYAKQFSFERVAAVFKIRRDCLINNEEIINFSHFYLSDPSIYQLSIDDYNKK